MVLERGRGSSVERIPDSLQALIGARIDRLPPAHRSVLRRAAVIGRVFWAGAIEHLSPDIEDVGEAIDDLLLRDFLLARGPLIDQRRGRVPLQARAHPRGRLRGPVQVGAGRPPRAVRRAGSRSAPATS